MKNILLVYIVVMLGCQNNNNQKNTLNTTDTTHAEVSDYDSVLAKRLGADQYGMKTYVMALLKKGKKRDQDSATVAQIQRGHMDNIQRMAKEGVLVVAGPFADDWDVRGIYIFNVSTVEEARRITETDPAIQAGRLEMELHPWYGSAAMMEINNIHNRIQKQKH